jgi:hypothetical protein
MQLFPIETIIADGEIVDHTATQTPELAGMVLGPHAACDTRATCDAPRMYATVDTADMDTAAHAFVNAAEATGVKPAEAANVHVADAAAIDPADMGASIEATNMAGRSHPADMRTAAESSHVATTAEATAARLRSSREQARRKQGRGQDRCQSYRHDTSFPCAWRDPSSGRATKLPMQQK